MQSESLNNIEIQESNYAVRWKLVV